MTNLTWVLESDVFEDDQARLIEAAGRAGHAVLRWRDDWWETPGAPPLSSPAVFHGSLGNADRVARELPWKPGAYCRTEAFRCSAYYPAARSWLVQTAYEVLPAEELVAAPDAVLARLGDPRRVFVRPDSPLKPFSGRVLERDEVSLAALDHGFYYDDAALPVVVAPARELGAEWRFVIADGQVVAGSGYDPRGRRPTGSVESGPAWELAGVMAAALSAPEPVYVLDLCQVDGALGLLELNPFSGADLYDCDRDRVVAGVEAAVRRSG